jgi:hypothetical protein
MVRQTAQLLAMAMVQQLAMWMALCWAGKKVRVSDLMSAMQTDLKLVL